MLINDKPAPRPQPHPAALLADLLQAIRRDAAAPAAAIITRANLRSKENTAGTSGEQNLAVGSLRWLESIMAVERGHGDDRRQSNGRYDGRGFRNRVGGLR